jgi:hypothetical protein
MDMPSSISNFERPIPALPWTGLALAAVLLTAAATVAWEIRCRAWGYTPVLNDTSDLWADRREAVQPDSIVIIGDSRGLFDMDLDQLEQGLGRRPIQLSLVGSCVYPILADLANDKSFHGTVICSVIPIMYFVPAGRPITNSEDALNRYYKRTVAQRSGDHLGMFLEEHIAFLKQEDLTLEILLAKLPIPNRPAALIGPALPPYFQIIDRERRTRMWDRCAQPGPLQDRVRNGWPPLFTAPPPPSYIPLDAFQAFVSHAVEARFHDSAVAVQKIRARGGKVVFVRYPVSGELKKLEDKATPRAGPWTRLLKETGAPGIYWEDYPELASFQCPEWSHLSGPDSVEFTKRLVPHLREALGQ